MNPTRAANCQVCGSFTAETQDWPYICYSCIDAASPSAVRPAFNGIRVIKSDELPANTMIVSADVYEALRSMPLDRDTEQLKTAGLSPTGRRHSEPNYQDVPKCCEATADEEVLLATGEYTPEELWGGSRPSCPKCFRRPGE